MDLSSKRPGNGGERDEREPQSPPAKKFRKEPFVQFQEAEKQSQERIERLGEINNERSKIVRKIAHYEVKLEQLKNTLQLLNEEHSRLSEEEGSYVAMNNQWIQQPSTSVSCTDGTFKLDKIPKAPAFNEVVPVEEPFLVPAAVEAVEQGVNVEEDPEAGAAEMLLERAVPNIQVDNIVDIALPVIQPGLVPVAVEEVEQGVILEENPEAGAAELFLERAVPQNAAEPEIDGTNLKDMLSRSQTLGLKQKSKVKMMIHQVPFHRHSKKAKVSVKKLINSLDTPSNPTEKPDEDDQEKSRPAAGTSKDQ